MLAAGHSRHGDLTDHRHQPALVLGHRDFTDRDCCRLDGVEGGEHRAGGEGDHEEVIVRHVLAYRSRAAHRLGLVQDGYVPAVGCRWQEVGELFEGRGHLGMGRKAAKCEGCNKKGAHRLGPSRSLIFDKLETAG